VWHIKYSSLPWLPFEFGVLYHRILNMSNTSGATSGLGNTHPSGVHPLHSCFRLYICQCHTPLRTLLFLSSLFIRQQRTIVFFWLDHLLLWLQRHIEMEVVLDVVFNATFNNFEFNRGENYRPVANHWEALSHNVVSSTRRRERNSNSQF
jgi:hypothetical protein